MTGTGRPFQTLFNTLNQEYLLFRHRRDVRHEHLVDEGTEAEPEVAGDAVHLLR